MNSSTNNCVKFPPSNDTRDETQRDSSPDLFDEDADNDSYIKSIESSEEMFESISCSNKSLSQFSNSNNLWVTNNDDENISIKDKGQKSFSNDNKDNPIIEDNIKSSSTFASENSSENIFSFHNSFNEVNQEIDDSETIINFPYPSENCLNNNSNNLSSDVVIDNKLENNSCSSTKSSNENMPIQLISSNNTNSIPPILSNRQKALIEQIENFLLKILSDLASGKKISIQLQNRSITKCTMVNNILLLKPIGETTGNNDIRSFYKISIIMFVMAEIYKNLKNNVTCTRREIYYNDPECTQTENDVDLAVRDICCLLNAQSWELGILSQSKGLIAGSVKINLPNDEIINVNSVSEGTLMPHFSTSIVKLESNAKFVLLVEKDTVFEKLLKDGFLLKYSGNCILITGKGYPDINTRIILKRIWDDLKIPIYVLVDADPYGIEILLIYQHGSVGMSYGNEHLAVPAIQWIGVLPSDIKRMGLPTQAMTKDDQLRVSDIMSRPYVNTQTYAELLLLQKGKQKCEIEAISSLSATYLVDTYLSDKLNGLI